MSTENKRSAFADDSSHPFLRLWRLESLDQVNCAIQGADRLEQLMSAVLDALLMIFGGKHAWLFSPCDPAAPQWQIVSERTGAEAPPALPVGVTLPMDDRSAHMFRTLRQTDGPVQFGPQAQPAPPALVTRAGPSFMALALCPQHGPTWGLGYHAGIDDREWTPLEEQLLQEIGQRLGVALAQQLTYHSLAESEARYRSLFHHINDGLEIVDPATERFLDINEHGCRTHGYTHEEYLALTVADIDPMIAAGSWEKMNWGEIWTGPRIFESQHRRKDGSLFPVEVNLNYVAAERPYMIALVRDITERQTAEKALKESEERYRTLFEDNPSMYFILEADGIVASVNRFGAEHLGYTVSELTGQSVLNVFHEEDKAAAQQAVRQCMDHLGDLFRWSLRKVRKDGALMWVEETARAMRRADGSIQVLIVCEDISELKRLEEQFRQAQKMEAVGQLAGGVAHDFNNLLMVINGYSGMVLEQLSDDDPNRRRLAEIQKAGERAATLTRQLLAFSRKQVLQPQVVHLNTLLSELLSLLRRLIGEDIELLFAPGSTLGLARVDPSQFEQAIINLVVNARDAMPQGGQLLIRTTNTQLDHHFTQYYPEVKSGSYIQVTVSDSGLGMNESVKARIFEPFFTTKELGKGTGLGLAMVYGFVKQSDGHIEVESLSGRGTTFKIYLPRAEEAAVSGRSLAEHPVIPIGTETILLVEDEEEVRRLCQQTLHASGYTVLEASNGQDALGVAQSYPGTIHILVTDLVMPRMSGRQLADALRQIRPNTRPLFISGYSDEAMIRHGVTEGSVVFLQKPFHPVSLLHKIREVLKAE